jgi:riboflavin synthase
VFTGIVEELGSVIGVTPLADSARITIRGPIVAADTRAGDSIAVNGVCLTVVEPADGTFVADVMGETLRRSALGSLAVGDSVNLERAARLESRIGGHLVQGHVDAVGTVTDRQRGEQWDTVRFALPAHLSRYVVEKGSIAVDGVSLTVMAVDDDSFAVGLIPTTLRATTLGQARAGTKVNLEVDLIAKYVEKLVRTGAEA